MTAPARPISPRQMVLLHVLFGERSMTRDARLAYCSDYLQRIITSTAVLSLDEAGALIDRLESEREGA